MNESNSPKQWKSANVMQSLLKKPIEIIEGVPANSRLQCDSSLILIAIVGLVLYGLVVGLFSGGTQLWAAPLKIVMGMVVSAAICFPSLYIFSCFTAVDFELGAMLRGLLVCVALLSVLLVGFAPVAWVFSQSTDSVAFMGSLHLALYACAVVASLAPLNKFLQAHNAAKFGYLRTWKVLFVIVTLQMSCALRPLIGTSDSFIPTDKKFFLSHWIETIDQEQRGTRKYGIR